MSTVDLPPLPDACDELVSDDPHVDLSTSVDDCVGDDNLAQAAVADLAAAHAPPQHGALRASTLAESIVILAIMAISQRMVGFVRGILFVRWLEPDELGQWDMSQGFLLLAAPLIVAGLPGCFGRYLEYYRQRGQLRAMLRRTATACALLTVVGIGSLLLLRPLCAYLMFGDWQRGHLAGLAAFTVITVIAFNFINEMLTGLRMFRLVSRLQFANTVAFAVFSLGLLVFWKTAALAVVTGYAAACILSVFCMVLYLRQIWHQLPADTAPLGHRELWRKLLPFAGWMWASTLMVSLFDVADRYMVLHFSHCSPDEALAQIGYYHSSRVIPVLMVTVAYLLSSMITPHLSHDWEAGAVGNVRNRLNTIIKAYGLLTFIGCTLLLWLSPILFGLVFRGKYQGGAAIFPLTLTYCSWMSLGALLQTYLWCAEKARLSCLAMMVGVAANVALNFWLLPLYGLHGAVFSTVVANSIVISLIVCIARSLGLKLERGAITILILPVTLAFGPVLASVALVGVLIDVFILRRFFSAEQEQMILAALNAKLGRFTKLFRTTRSLDSAAPRAS